MAAPARHWVSERPRRQRERAHEMGRSADPEDLLRRAQRKGRRRADRRRGPATLPEADRRVVMRFVLVIVAALLAVPVAYASERHPTQAELEGEVMCPVCGTTLDQSDSPAARQIERFIKRRIAAGDSEQEIKDALVANYGESILASPPKHGFGLLAWWVPLGGILVAAVLLGWGVWRWSHSREPGHVAATAAAPPGPPLHPPL